MGCKKCQLPTEHAEVAAKQLGIDYQIEKVTDVDTITEMDVMVTPALTIYSSVEPSDKTSSPEEIKKILRKC